MSTSYLVHNNMEIPLKQQTTVGRIPTNIIQIVDNTVSKNHAIISCINNKNYIIDLNTINGTYLNGQKIQTGKQIQIVHNDSIQFGHYNSLYVFKERNPPPVGKKINLKDYHFELETKSVGNQRVQHKKNVSKETSQHNFNRSKSKNKTKETRVKIPQLSDFLKIVDQPLIQKKQDEIQTKKIKNKDKIKFNQLGDIFNSQQLQQNRNMNIYLKQQQLKKQRQEQQKILKQNKLKLQIQKHKQQQLMIKKQLQLQKKLQQEQQKLYLQRKRVQQQIFQRAKQRRQQQQQLKLQFKRKQQEFIQKLRKQKQQQIQVLKERQQQNRLNHQKSISQDYQNRKKQLQIQAQALARQYQNIYRETIQKVKNDINKQQQIINNYQEKIQQNIQHSYKLNNYLDQTNQQLSLLKQQYLQINSKNKALILYASHLQDKIDKLKLQKNTSPKVKTKYKQLKQSIIHSRKYLSIKIHQQQCLENQFKKLKINLLKQCKFSQKTQDYLENIIQNHQNIENMKSKYFQLIQQDKNIQSIWQIQLEQNNKLSQKQKSLLIQLQNNKKQFNQQLNDNLKKLCQQRLHLLKIGQTYMSQQKRKAAKYLIQQMVDINKQIIRIIMDNQNFHLKIGKIITQSQQIRKDNTYLSQLLFGQGSIHHLDNMKLLINQLVQKIESYKDSCTVDNCLKINQEILKYQKMIYNQLEKNKQIKSQQVKYMNSANKIIKLNQKNPLHFFGNVLLKKDTQVNRYQQSIKYQSNQLTQLIKQINQLETRKNQMSNTFQKYQKIQMQQARNWIIN